jgi:hypothetical protein
VRFNFTHRKDKAELSTFCHPMGDKTNSSELQLLTTEPTNCQWHEINFMKVNTTELAVVLGITERRVYALLKEGILQHSDEYGRSLFDLEHSAQAYKDFITQPVRQIIDYIDKRLEQSKQNHADLILQQSKSFASDLQKVWVKPTAEEQEQE